MPDFQFIIHGEMRWLWNDPTLKMLTMHYLYTYNNECKIFRRFQSALRRQSTIKTPCSHPQFSWKKVRLRKKSEHILPQIYSKPDWRLEWFWNAVCLKPLNPQTWWAPEPTFSFWWPQMTIFDPIHQTEKSFLQIKMIFIHPAIHFLGYRRKKV